MANANTAYAANIIPDDAQWARTPFAVDLSGNQSKDFQTVDEMLTFVMNSGYNAQDSPTKDVVRNILTAGENNASPSFTNKPYLADTRLGMNDAINVLWQFNRDDDIIHPVNMTSDNQGMGRVYSQMIEKHQQIVWMTFGVPEFTGLLDFYTNAVDMKVANFMRNGGGSLISDISSVIGSTVGFAIKLPFMPFIWLKKLADIRNIFKVTKYYDFRSTMPLYYQAVTTMLSHLAVNMGFISGFDSEFDGESTSDNAVKEALPIFLQKSGPDIYRILMQRSELRLGQTNPGGLISKTSAELLEATNRNDMTTQSAEAMSMAGASVDADNKVSTPKEWASNSILDNDYGGSFLQGMMDTALGGLSYVGFRIEKSTDSSESFSNSTGESSIAQTLNSQASSNRDKSFGTMGGKTGIDVVDGVVESLKSFATSMSEVTSTDVLLNAYSGSAYIDIPEVWQNSTFGKSYSFDMQLRAPYGDPISIFQSIYVPLCMVLAAALPRAAGKHAYTSPFLIRAYCRGMFSIPLGIIESISIRRGGSEFGWNINQLPTQVDISFTIKDLSPNMYMAIGTGTIGTELAAIFSQNSSFQEYLMTLGGLGLAERVMFFKNLSRRFDQFLTTMRNTYTNPLYWSNRIGDSSVIRMIGNFMPFDAIPRN